MTKFQCIRSGNFVSFSNPNDIEGMRKHEGYREVKDDAQTTETVKTEPQSAPVKEVLKVKRKNTIPSFLQG